MRTNQLAAVGAVVLGTLAAAISAPAQGSDVSDARAATAPYHNIDKATADGYGEFRDAQQIACIDNPGVGGMGIHYVNGTYVGDAEIDATKPEALVYEPQRNGRLRLVAVEYIVFQSAWDDAHGAVPPQHAPPPELFGQGFELVDTPNRYGLPPFYELHAWLWKNNPRGFFDDWNPRVSCDA